MLSANQFQVLTALRNTPGQTQREVAAVTGMALGTVSTTLSGLKGGVAPAVDGQNKLTGKGLALLEPYRVDNAVIMAAGLSSRFAPISYEKPKGLLSVRGEVLIERQIRQLKEAGINEIFLVLGYKKEEFFYLEDAFGVKIRINEEYASRNNNSTIKCVEDVLGNTFICSSDDYFTSNPFEPYVYRSYYAATYSEGPTAEYCFVTTGRENRVKAIEFSGCDAWELMGHAYWDRSFSKKFIEILNQEYDWPETAPKLWEDIFAAHVAELPMVVRKYPNDAIWEFDSLDEVSAFDPTFIQNVDSGIFDNICEILKCGRADIAGIVPIKQGLTNLSFKFSVLGEPYVYRHPGEGTDEIINRESEAFSQSVAHELGLDDTFIYEDGRVGWKISRFIEGCHTLDYHNWNEVEMAMDRARRLHGCGVSSPWSFDIYDEAQKIVRLLDERSRTTFKDFAALLSLAEGVHDMVVADGVERCLCHNDFYDPNFLVRGDEMYLIDWEYSGMSDYASDLGTFVCCSDYGYEEAVRVYELYFRRPLEKAEARHCVAYTALASFYWFVWALYKEACGDPVGEWLYLWYKNVKVFGSKALEISASM